MSKKEKQVKCKICETENLVDVSDKTRMYVKAICTRCGHIIAMPTQIIYKNGIVQ